MSKKSCLEGQKYDILLRMCLNRTESSRKVHPKADPVPTIQNQLIQKTMTRSHHLTAPAMSKKSCLEGQKYDNLLRKCLNWTESSRKVHPKAEPVPTIQSSALWGFLILAIMGSVLSLVLWCVIFRRQTRDSSNSEEAPELKPVQKTDAAVHFYPPPSERNGQAETFQRAADLPSACHQLHLGAQMGSEWEDHFAGCRGPARYGSKEGGGGLPACSTVADHRIPLPATELGGTVLVTTKTV
ncbi:uncharacterized protein LOC121654466 isoform X2 [Melanotaenia boesemani]|uniref:uncharacterized protein LOC121654466 isoform X2 n=1 Tax=Melanotaenia boesemani TaxID=1250792 RepID=UPI001C052CEA|nr:uncharacterized protein LOC121654466 isoform X2 [Melanotaenia boesemani]